LLQFVFKFGFSTNSGQLQDKQTQNVRNRRKKEKKTKKREKMQFMTKTTTDRGQIKKRIFAGVCP